MADWKNEIDLRDVWGPAEAGEIAPTELARKIGERLGALELKGPGVLTYRDEIKDLGDEFGTYAEANPDAEDFDDLDNLMERLYNLADTKLDNRFNGAMLLWVRTV